MADQYEIFRKGNSIEFIVKGEMDTALSNKMQHELNSLTDENLAGILFDLSKVTFIASSGLRCLIIAQKRFCDKKLVKVKGASGPVLNVIKLSGLDSYVEII